MGDYLTRSTLKSFNKDKNNNLNEKDCIEFIELYNNSQGNITNILNPKTKKKISDMKRIRFIYEKCLNKVDKSNVVKVNTPDVYNEMLSNITLSDLLKIIEDPLLNSNYISKITTKIFGNNNKDNIIKLKEYLDRTDNETLIKYKDCISEINKYIKGFDPFMGNTKFKKYVEKNYRNEYVNEGGVFYISKKLTNILKKPKEYLTEAIMYNSISNKNSIEFKKNLENNFSKYYSINYILSLLTEYSISDDVLQKAIMTDFTNILLNNEIIIKYSDNSSSSLSLDKSISYSVSPCGSTSKAISHREVKKKLLSYIMNNEGYSGDINDYDFYTMDKWSDMPLQKLKYIIKIPYTLGSKTFCNAYYAKSLYKAWDSSVKQKQNFINPTNRIEFNDDDKKAIMDKMVEMYPHIKKPNTNISMRNDLYFNFIPVNDFFDNNTGENIDTICISIFYKIKNSNPLLTDYGYIDLVKVYIPLRFAEYPNSEIPDNYSYFSLQDKIEELSSRNKLLGKTIPFKLNKAIEKYNYKILTNKEDYIDFYNML